MLSISDLKPGVAIIFNGQPHIVTWREHAMMGRGGGFVRTKMKNLLNGALVDNTFKGNDKITEADLARSQAQFLYFEGDTPVFMDMSSYEQFTIPRDQVGDSANYLKEEMMVDVLSYQGKPITVTLPIKVELKVTYTEPGFKGNTASATTKPATIETGTQINVPLFINTGDVIRIDTRTGEYVERVK